MASVDRPNPARSPVRWVRWWLREKQPTNIDQGVWTGIGVVAGVVASVLVGAVAAVIYAVVKGGETLPVWTSMLIAVAVLFLGLFGGGMLMRTLYEPHLQRAEGEVSRLRAEIDAAQARLETAQVQALIERERREQLEPDSEAITRLAEYLVYIYRVLDDVGQSYAEFVDLSKPDVQRTFCELPRDVIEDASGVRVVLSVWIQGNPEQLRDRIPAQVRERLPDAAQDLVHRFWIPCAPDHTHTEIEDFCVPIRPSWIQHSHELMEQDPEDRERIFKADPLSIAGVRGRDIDAFRKHGYDSVRGAAFRFGDRRGYVIALTKEARVLSPVEDFFIAMLAAALACASDLATAHGLFTA